MITNNIKMKNKNYIFLAITALTVSVILNGCGGSFLIQKTAEFENKTWLLQSIDYNDIPNTEGKLFLKFSRSTKKFSGFGGCNNIVGSYSITGSDITIKPSSSKETCLTGMETEKNMINILEKASEFREVSSSGNEYLSIISSEGSTLLLRLKQ